MPKTMTFDRLQLDVVRIALREELKKADRLLKNAQKKGDKYLIEARERYLERVAALLQEAQLPVMVTRRNLLTGQEYQEAEDTPNYCSPASEAYHSM